MVTWPLKRKLVESMEYTDAWFIQQGVGPIHSLTHLDCIVIDTSYLNIYSHIYVT